MLIQKGKVLSMESPEEVIDIRIENGKIKEMKKDLKPLDGEEVIDATGKWVLPGFVEAHCHLGMWEDAIGFEGADGNEMTDPITPHLRAIDAINPYDRCFEEAREGGVTCCATGPGSANIIGGQFAVIKTVGSRIDDMVLKAPLAMKCAFGENPKRVYSESKKAPNTRMSIAGELRNALYEAKSYKEKKEAAKDDFSALPPYNMKWEALLPVLNKEIPLKAHAHRADDIFTAIRIAKEFGLDLTLEHCSEGHLVAEHIAKEGFPAVVGPSFGARTKYELKNLCFETPDILSRAGVKVAIMTDHPVIPLQHLSLCGALAVKAGMDEEEALRAITITAAEILGIEDRVGSLKVGKDGDVVVWKGHPFSMEGQVVFTIIDGEVVYRNDSLV